MATQGYDTDTNAYAYMSGPIRSGEMIAMAVWQVLGGIYLLFLGISAFVMLFDTCWLDATALAAMITAAAGYAFITVVAKFALEMRKRKTGTARLGHAAAWNDHFNTHFAMKMLFHYLFLTILVWWWHENWSHQRSIFNREWCRTWPQVSAASGALDNITCDTLPVTIFTVPPFDQKMYQIWLLILLWIVIATIHSLVLLFFATYRNLFPVRDTADGMLQYPADFKPGQNGLVAGRGPSVGGGASSTNGCINCSLMTHGRCNACKQRGRRGAY